MPDRAHLPQLPLIRHFVPPSPKGKAYLAILSALGGCVDDNSKVRSLQGCAADQTAVHVLLAQQLLAVLCVHAAAVLHGGSLGNCLAVELAHHLAAQIGLYGNEAATGEYINASIRVNKDDLPADKTFMQVAMADMVTIARQKLAKDTAIKEAAAKTDNGADNQ